MCADPAFVSLSTQEWRPYATRLAVLIADAPPHGIGEYGDGFAEGSPEGSDPLVLARTMAQMGIALFMVACEPALACEYVLSTFIGLVCCRQGLIRQGHLLPYSIQPCGGLLSSPRTHHIWPLGTTNDCIASDTCDHRRCWRSDGPGQAPQRDRRRGCGAPTLVKLRRRCGTCANFSGPVGSHG